MEIDGQDFVRQSLEEASDYLAEDDQDDGPNNAECQQHLHLLSVLQQLVERLHTSNCMLRRINYLQAKGLLDVITQPVTVGSVTIGPDIVDRLNREEAENNQKSRRFWEQLHTRASRSTKKRLKNWSFDFDGVDRAVEEAMGTTVIEQEHVQQGQVRTRSGRLAGTVKMEPVSDGDTGEDDDDNDNTAIDDDYFVDVDKDLFQSQKTYGKTPKRRETAKPNQVKQNYYIQRKSRLAYRKEPTQSQEAHPSQNTNQDIAINSPQVSIIINDTNNYANASKTRAGRKKSNPFKKPRKRYYHYACDWPNCSIRVATPSILEIHKLKHTGELPHPCPDCDKRFRTPKAVELHRNRYHLNIRPYGCQQCKAKFATKTDLAVHEVRHTEDKYKFKCEWPGCTEMYTSGHDLKNHRRLHTGDLFKCTWPGCDKEFHVRSEFNGHLSTHTNHGDIPCKQPSCHRMFFRQRELRQHLAREHSIKHYACDWPGCEMSFVTAGQLRMHSKRHLIEKALVCDWPGCQYRTKWRSGYTAHVMAHKGEKPYVCDVCGYRTNQCSNLKKHKDGVHKKHFLD